MREGLDAPTESISGAELDGIRSYLDSQARVDLAVWVRHEHQGLDGPQHDHHLMLGIADDDYAAGDMRALEAGIELRLRQHGWLDLFPLSEVEALRPFGTVVWERGGRPRAGDRLDFRFTSEPLAVSREVVEAFAELVRGVEGVDRIEGTLERLWEGDDEVQQELQLHVAFHRRRPFDFEQVQSAAREAGLTAPRMSMSAGLPHDPAVRTATLYEAAH
jgi:hypothetical protein